MCKWRSCLSIRQPLHANPHRLACLLNLPTPCHQALYQSAFPHTAVLGRIGGTGGGTPVYRCGSQVLNRPRTAEFLRQAASGFVVDSSGLLLVPGFVRVF